MMRNLNYKGLRRQYLNKSLSPIFNITIDPV
jgi:hypothetical protein